MTTLPTADQMLKNAADEMGRAYDALNEAGDWLRSDWRPLGSSLTREQAARRIAMRKAISEAKATIESALHEHR